MSLRNTNPKFTWHHKDFSWFHGISKQDIMIICQGQRKKLLYGVVCGRRFAVTFHIPKNDLPKRYCCGFQLSLTPSGHWS